MPSARRSLRHFLFPAPRNIRQRPDRLARRQYGLVVARFPESVRPSFFQNATITGAAALDRRVAVFLCHVRFTLLRQLSTMPHGFRRPKVREDCDLTLFVNEHSWSC